MAFLFVILMAFQATTTPPFWSYWGDGKAEIDSYSVEQSRYNQPRKATLVMIYVTEPFNLAKQVKSDVSNDKDPNIISVLKLNKIKKFQTGIYDYTLMTSVFTPVSMYSVGKNHFDGGTPLKVNFSAHEWCGISTHQLNRTENGMNSRQLSYFESEGDKLENLKSDNRTLYADNLFIDVREVLAALEPGNYTYYPTLEYCRLFHKPLSSLNATVQKSDTKIGSGSKSVDATHWTITAGGQVWTFDVEKESSRKILTYEFRNDNQVIESGKLIKSVRLPYWKLNQNGDEKYLKQLGF